MLSRLRHRFRAPSAYEGFAIVLAFLALGSGSYAAVTITGKNVKNSSLTGKDIKNSSLTGSDVKNSSLGTSDVKNGSLLSKDFKSGQLPAGARGPQGIQGLKGDPGPTEVWAVELSGGNASVNLPAGNYVGDVPVIFHNSGPGTANMGCSSISASQPATNFFGHLASESDVPNGAEASGTTSFDFTTSGGMTLTVHCPSGNGTLRVYRVNTLHQG
jgi:hypothetical protein